MTDGSWSGSWSRPYGRSGGQRLSKSARLSATAPKLLGRAQGIVKHPAAGGSGPRSRYLEGGSPTISVNVRLNVHRGTSRAGVLPLGNTNADRSAAPFGDVGHPLVPGRHRDGGRLTGATCFASGDRRTTGRFADTNCGVKGVRTMGSGAGRTRHDHSPPLRSAGPRDAAATVASTPRQGSGIESGRRGEVHHPFGVPARRRVASVAWRP